MMRFGMGSQSLYTFLFLGTVIEIGHGLRPQSPSINYRLPSGASWDSTPSAPTCTGTAQNCNRWHKIVNGDTCDSLLGDFGITRNQFLAWNLAVSEDCTENFWLGEAYCVGIGSELVSTSSILSSSGRRTRISSLYTTGSISPCTRVVSGSIPRNTSSIGGAGTRPVTTSPVNSTYSIRSPTTPYELGSTTIDSAWPPTKTQPGQPSYCNKWHLVGAGDTCASIVAMYGGSVSTAEL